MSNELLEREQVSVVVDLESPDEEIRRLAIERALSLPAPAAVPRLVDGLGDPSWRVRKAAVERLVFCTESELVFCALIDALSDGENPGRRNAAVEALVHCGIDAIPALTQALESPDVDVRKLVVDALAGIGDESARSSLFPILGDPDSNVRAAAADALGVIGGAEVAERLTELARRSGEDRLVRLSALRGLACLEVPLGASELEESLSDSVLRPAVYTLLGYSPDEGALEVLLKGVASSSRAGREAAMAAVLQRLSGADGVDAERVGEGVRELVRGSEELLARILERLEEADLPTRLMLVQFLGLVASKSCVLPILEAGRDEALSEVARATLNSLADVAESAIDEAWDDLDGELRAAACTVLANGHSDQSTSRLREELESPDRGVRIAAAHSLAKRRCGAALEDLVNRLGRLDEDGPECEDEREALVEALAVLGRPAPEGGGLAGRAIELMASRLDGSKSSMRLSMAALLGEIGTASNAFSGELIAQLLRDPIPRVRRAALQTLARLEPGRVRESLRLSLADEAPLVRVAAALALGTSDEEGVLEDLERLIQDEDARARAAAVRAMGDYCSRKQGRSEQGIALIARATEDHCLVAIAAVEALDRLGGDAAALAACSALSRSEQELVQAAAECVGRRGSVETLVELLPLVSHENWMVRAEAIRILGERRFVQAVPSILRSLETEQHDFVRQSILDALKRLEE